MIKQEELEKKPLSELLEIYAQVILTEKNQSENLNTVRGYILENFTEKPMTKLRYAFQEVDAMDLSKQDISNIKEAKFCAANIADHLDPRHIDGTTSIKAIFFELVQLSESKMDSGWENYALTRDKPDEVDLRGY